MTMTAPETYAAAIDARPYSEIFEDLTARLEAKGFSPRTYSTADFKYALMAVVGDVREGDEAVRAQLVRGGFIDDAESPWLDLLCAGFFQVLRKPATVATIRLRLTDTANVARPPFAGPLTAAWNPGDPTNALFFSCASGVVVPRGGFVDVEFVAERAGAAYNILPNSITSLATPIAGIAISSPPIPGSASIVLVPGSDAESDASLRAAAKDKWSLLRRGWSAATIRALLRDLIPEATRVLVRDDNPLPGEAWVYLATATGALPQARLIEATQWFRGENIKPLSNKPLRFFTATPVVYSLEGTIYTDGTANALALAQQRLAAYTYDYPLGKPIYREAIEATLRSPANGVQAATVTSIDPILLSAPTEIVQFAFNMTQAPASILQ